MRNREDEVTPPYPTTHFGTTIQQEGPGGISITRLQFPIGVTATIITTIIGGVISVTLLWSKMSSHVTDGTVHVDPGHRERGGGLAYQNDVKEAVQHTDEAIRNEHVRIRTMLHELEWTCRPQSGGGMNCKSILPE